MRLPRDLGGDELIRRLQRLGYQPSRQAGSHVRLTRSTAESEHHVTIPRHSPLRVGTLNSILSEIAEHLNISKDELLKRIA